MIPYGKQCIDRKDIESVLEVLNSEYITQGPKVIAFERALAHYAQARYAVAVSSGTAALHLAYITAGFCRGDEVITTPNSFVATANMLLHVGVRPVFCDIRQDTYNIDELKIEPLITKRTRAIAPVHFAGQPCEMDTIKKIADKYKLTIIEDACHALGAQYKNKHIGSLGDMTVFSFHPVKSITTGEGGAILTNNKTYYKKLLSLRQHGIHKDGVGKNVMTELGFNYRLSDIHSALGISQLKRLDMFIKARRRVVKWYSKYLANVSSVILPMEIKECYSSWHIYVIRIKDKSKRDKLAKYLKSEGVGVNWHYPAIYSHPYYRQNGYAKTKLKMAELYADSCLTLPCFPTLAEKKVLFICNIIKKFFGKK